MRFSPNSYTLLCDLQVPCISFRCIAVLHLCPIQQRISQINIAQFNANSLLGHIDQIKIFFEQNFYHIISISETWLHSYISDDVVRLNNYFLIRNDREGREGGGVACYIHNSLKVKVLAMSPSEFSNSPEFLILDIHLSDSESILFSSIYRRPKGLLFNEYLNTLSRFSHAYPNIVIGGDLNCNLSTINHESSFLKEMVSSLAMDIVQSDSTYHTASSDSWLDVFIIDSLEKLCAFHKSDAPFIAGHDLISLAYKFARLPNIERQIERRSLKNFVDDLFVTSLSRCMDVQKLQIPNHCNSCDVDSLLNSLDNLLLSEYDNHAPLRTFKVHKPTAPWLSLELKNRIKQRNSLYKQAKRANSLLGLQIYRNYRDALTHDLRLARNNYHLQRLSNITDTGFMWRELSNLGLIRSAFSSPLHFFSADELNNHYVAISNSQQPCTWNEIENLLHIIPSNDHPFTFTNVSVDEVANIILSSTTLSHSSGPDKISSFLLQWKRAYIRPLSKVNAPRTPSDTRPIANLSELSKVYERVAQKQITDYIKRNSILDPRQSGYRTRFSTQSALLRICHDVRKGVDMGLITILVLFDFSKAFDTVSHLRLLRKLRISQAVVDESGRTSRWQFTAAGVPQGSVLGPLLFSIFINDIGSSLKYSDHMIFADDTQIYLQCSPAEILVGLQKITRDVVAISEFATANELSLNLGKSKILIQGSGANVNAIDVNSLPVIAINGVAIPYVNEAKNLGVVMCSNLSWSRHVSTISRRVHYTLHKIKYHRNALSRELKAKLVTTLIFPLLDYCCLVYNDVTDELKTKLQRLINTSVRFVFNLRRDEHITPYRLRLGWLSAENRRLYFLGITVFKILESEVPTYISELFLRPAEGLRQSERRALPTFHVPIHRTATYRNSFHLLAAYFWHSLPLTIKSSPTLQVLKSRLFAHLLESEILNYNILVGNVVT
ncbi:uncharacterized protein LOC124413491 [Diprion similis]|uniref:uncharacterized protein LOC124413491 n=1 Tax=Diprion similis TaxID=362088 RepID=UPI001EF94B01|nr:uncharacterized protein LOC124413491 [Diprion similis]